MKSIYSTFMILAILLVSLTHQNSEAMNKNELKQLHDQYGELYDLPVGDKTAYLREPEMADYKRAFSAMQRGGDIAFGEAMLDSLFVGGDEEIKTNDDYFLPARKALVDFFNYEDAQIESLKNGNYQITIGNHKCEIRKIHRNDLKVAEKKNPGNKPFVTQEKLFEEVCVKKDEAFNDRKNASLRFPLFQAMEQLQNQKVALLKKRSPMKS